MDFNDIISATNDNVANENHDKRDIRVDMPEQGDRPTSAPSLPSWDAGEMGMSLAELQSRWDRANTPEAKEALRQEIAARSNRRANLFQRADGTIAVMVSGEPAWHELGFTMRADFTAAQIKELCLNWEYEVLDARDTRGNPIPRLHYVELVQKTGERNVLSGVGVGNRYALTQPADFVDWSAKLVGSISGAHFVAAGAVDEAKRIWCQAKLPEVLEPIRGDVTEHYLLTTDVFDSSGTQKAITTAERAVCDNTLRLACSNGSLAFSNRHTTNMADRMEKYAEYCDGIRQAWHTFSDAAPSMVSTSTSVIDFARPILDDVLGVTEAQNDVSKALELTLAQTEIDERRALLEKRVKKTGKALETILDIAESDTNTAKGSVWGALQSTTQFANHNLSYKGESKATGKAQFESVLLGGRADEISQLALESALDLAS